jgi:hypothetical protein
MKIKKKELAIGIVAIILIATVGTIYGLSKSGGTTDEPKKIEKTAKKEDKKKVKTAGVKSGKAEDKKTDTKGDIKAEGEGKTDTAEKAVKNENNGTKISSSARSSTSSTNPPSASGSSGSAPAPKPKRWVVDQAAWDEEVRQPVYVNTWWCKLEDGTMLTFYSEQEAYNYYMNNFCSWGTGERVPDPSGATEVIGYIHHNEVGHWE